MNITFQQVTMAKSIDAWMWSFLTILKDSSISHHGTELFHVTQVDRSLRTHKPLVNVNVGKHLIVAIPQLPVKNLTRSLRSVEIS
jgi:hypothetical protein